MEAFSKKVRTFDAFPKVDAQHTQRSERGGAHTMLTLLCCLLIGWVEFGAYLGGYIDKQFGVDPVIQQELAINVDMLIAMPCDNLHTNVRDLTNDRFLAGETLNFLGSDFFTPQSYRINVVNEQYAAPEFDTVFRDSVRAAFSYSGVKENTNAEACHIFGSIPVNHVKGEFHITARGLGYRDMRGPRIPTESLNFSHVIQEFSFGDYYPYFNNPLDGTGKVTEDNLQRYNYFTNVVPTHYERLGLEIDTYQYSLTEFAKTCPKDRNGIVTGIPGIYFRYDFEPLRLEIIERRLGFLAFVSRLGTIVGGLLIVGNHFFRLYERLLALVFGKKYVDKGKERSNEGIIPSKI
ncbi:ER-derived vesicles protein Erv41p [Diutina catenulata]